MNRRHFIASAATAAFSAFGGATLLLPAHALAGNRVFYTPGLAEKAMDEGKVLVLDFWTNWCSTCAAQERVMAGLRKANPEYERRITFITVDWDQYSDGELSRSLAIPRRSTLVALKGRQELGRIVAGTSRDQIRALLDTALSSATS